MTVGNGLFPIIIALCTALLYKLHCVLISFSLLSQVVYIEVIEQAVDAL